MMTERRANNPCVSVLAALLTGASLLCPLAVRGDAGPPYLTNDPGTPANANWEINLAAMQTSTRELNTLQLPQIDMNFGVGERLQLSFEIPYVFQSAPGQAQQSGWSNANAGVKWRFLDQGGAGWQMSVFPQVEMAGSSGAQRRGIAADGPRLLLPLEVAKTIGSVNWNFELGYYLPNQHGPEERILGLVAGRAVSASLELDAELYSDHGMGAPPDNTTLDIGGRYRLQRGFILLFMAGRSIGGGASNPINFMGYLGVQILLSDYGRALTPER
jgi:hypothetical protein